ncbi:polynucleotidyl transferase [Striga asiatica]|uniref:Polynucleotidyl transferase n=1 Tax=Striga asiatica TaxID=4170 RepID=A0A5A7R356_STRAF|nr:polynucleotidyl transferase [Striga asiatica]
MLLRPVKELVITGCRLAPVVRLSLLLRRAPPSSLHLRRRCSSVLIDPPSSLLLRPVKELVVTDSPVVQAHRLSLSNTARLLPKTFASHRASADLLSHAKISRSATSSRVYFRFLCSSVLCLVLYLSNLAGKLLYLPELSELIGVGEFLRGRPNFGLQTLEVGCARRAPSSLSRTASVASASSTARSGGRVPQSLEEFLTGGDYAFVGVGVQQDFDRIDADYGIEGRQPQCDGATGRR